jgi:hypothetical protein
MTIRRIASILCRVAVGIGSLLVSMYGIYSFDVVALAPNRVRVFLYCLLPVLFFPVFVLSFWRLRLAVILYWVFAAGYLVVYSILDRRPCSELGYCGSVLSTVMETLTARPVEATFAIALVQLAAWRLAGRPQSAR